MKLLTNEIEKLITKYPLYSQDGVEDKFVIAKFFYGGFIWYVYEGEKQENGDYLFYGLVDGLEKDLGYFTLNQLEGVIKNGYPCIERDIHFKPSLMSKVA